MTYRSITCRINAPGGPGDGGRRRTSGSRAAGLGWAGPGWFKMIQTHGI